MPYLSTPDPSVKRASGFLSPTFLGDASNGWGTSAPYFWVLGPDKDATINPIFTTGGGVVIDGQYRERWGFGKLVLDGSVAFGSQAESTNLASPVPVGSEVRGHLFAKGEFDIDPEWRLGVDVQTASDLTYLQRYHFYYPNANFLTSRVFLEDFTANSYANISTMGFESLSPAVSSRVQPFAAPVATYRWVGNLDPLGGKIAFTGNFADIVRLEGTDMRRASAGADWTLPFDGLIGDKFTLIATGRGDSYYSNELLLSPADTEPRSAAAARFFPQAELLWRYPWVRRDEGMTELIEPIAALVAAPIGGNPATIPNEDSQGFEFDETSLFRPNRFPGYDRVDGGQRVDYGLHAGVYNDRYGSMSFLAGQSYSFQSNSAFLPGLGLGTHRSDVVGRVDLVPNTYLDLLYRLRLGGDDLALRRQEAGALFGPSNLRMNVSYVSFEPVSGIANLEQRANQILLGIKTNLTRYWSVSAVDTRNLGGGGGVVRVPSSVNPGTGTTVSNSNVLAGIGATIVSGVSVSYRDECFGLTTTIAESGISLGDVKPGYVFLLTFDFKNLGEYGLKAATFGGGPAAPPTQ
jgi:LPS-assembly protein